VPDPVVQKQISHKLPDEKSPRHVIRHQAEVVIEKDRVLDREKTPQEYLQQKHCGAGKDDIAHAGGEYITPSDARTVRPRISCPRTHCRQCKRGQPQESKLAGGITH